MGASETRGARRGGGGREAGRVGGRRKGVVASS